MSLRDDPQPWQINVTYAEADAVEQLISWALGRGEYDFGVSRSEVVVFAGKLRELMDTAEHTAKRRS